MFRKPAWRRTASDVLHWHQDQAARTTIFILREFGPTGFLLKEEGESKNFKVCLGNPHTCTCFTYIKEKDLCKHICWVLMRKFRLPKDHEYCLQLGLVDGQITEMLQGLHSAQTARTEDTAAPALSEEDGCVKQKEVGEEDVCPICQEDLLSKRLPVSYCRYGCGNNVHISCMKLWADHQTRSDLDTMVRCPLCREAFEPMRVLLDEVKNAASLVTMAERAQQDKHLGIPCNGCNACPISGKCFKCIVCSYYHLCEDCFPGHLHPQHPFAFRARRSQRWVSLRHSAQQKSGQSQEWDPQSAEDPDSAVQCDSVPEQIVRSLLAVKVRQGSKLLKQGQQCRLCLKSFRLGQQVKHLPCHHKFHAECADACLLQSNCCPLDGHVVYNPLTWQKSGKQFGPKSAQSPSAHTQQNVMDLLFIPGQGLNLGINDGSPIPLQKEPGMNTRMHKLPVKNENADSTGCASESHQPLGGASPPHKGTWPAPCRDSQSRDPSNARAGGFVRTQKVKRGMKIVAGVRACADRDRPAHDLSVGLNVQEMQVHSRETGRAVPNKKLQAPKSVPGSSRERDQVTHTAAVSPDCPQGSFGEKTTLSDH
ncbi:hypothetical protein GJAV_G00209330 [Gymnothorax javanicus]|nr:hypothetical protein GJAV_G00209330 [Gymnothorax javanicus]